MRIGIDLDNTIIHYDNAFISAARERGLVPSDFSGTKQQLRDRIRTLSDGEMQWQKLQGYVYGKGIDKASLFAGVEQCITHAVGQGHALFIVSHKTEFGHYDEDKINLRDAATAFLSAQGLFDRLGFKRDHIFFAETRAEKIKVIASLQLNCFIDDLVEVFAEPDFPHATRRILLHTSPTPAPLGDWQPCHNWHEIEQAILS